MRFRKSATKIRVITFFVVLNLCMNKIFSLLDFFRSHSIEYKIYSFHYKEKHPNENIEFKCWRSIKKQGMQINMML